jgi:hypothetical protein
MKDTRVPFWLTNAIIFGRENDGNEGGKQDNEGDDPEDNGEEGEGEDEGGEGSSESGSGDEDDPAALKKALAEERRKNKEERRLRRKAERDAREKQTSKKKDEENEDLAQTKTQLQTEREKAQRLATRLLKKERDDAILAAARKAGFIDPTDALTDDIRQQVEVDQDPEDPADIEVDEDSAAEAVRKLANRKKHLIGKPNEGEPSGGRFSRKGKNGAKDGLDEATLAELYPGLR